MKQRVITAVVLLALLAVVVWQIYTPLFIAVIAFLSAVAANEIIKCAKVQNKFLIAAGTVVGFIVPLFSSASVLEPVPTEVWGAIISAVPTTVFVIAIAIVLLLSMLKEYSITKFEDVAITFFAGIVVPYGFSTFGRLRDIAGFREQIGVYLIFYGLIAALGTDTGAQLGGMAFGKHKMCPNISPKKTVEGAVSGVITGVVLNAVAMVLYNKFAVQTLDKTTMITLMVCAPFVSFLSMMGDLSASVLKRNFGVKDFGKIFPGHGGVMDRFDSSLFTVPITYCIAAFLIK